MATTRRAVPAKKPVAARRVPAKRAAKKAPVKKAAKKSAAKKAAGKRVVKISATPRRLTVKQAYKKKSKSVRAGVAKRKQTLAATRVDVGPEPVAVEPTDEVAHAKLAKRQWRGRRTAADRANDPPPSAGIALVERVTRAVERELTQIEVIVGGHHVKVGQRTEAERRARTLASLARTLTEVRKLRADEEKLKPEHDQGPRDINEFRLELARKLDRLAAEAQVLFPVEPDGAGES